VTRVGIDNRPNQYCGNLIQVMYVMMPMKPPTQESMKEWQEQQVKMQQEQAQQ
jgi:hypothetical protein